MIISIFLFYFLLIIIICSHFVNCSHIQCCQEAGVPHHCAKSLCNLNAPPGDLERYSLFDGRRTCATYLPEISTCLADGRDSTACCVKEAESPDDSACFGICNGTMEYDTTRNIAYFQSCFSVNTDAIYKCIKSSHNSSPSMPRDLELEELGENSVRLNWKQPLKNARYVTFYKVHVVESRNMRNTPSVYSTKNLEFTINNLKSESTYSFFVIAHGKSYQGNDEYYKSTPSNIIHFTLSKNILVFDKIKRLPKQADSAELSCHLKVLHGTKPIVEWEKSTIDGTQIIENSQNRFIITQYSSDTTPRFMVSSLEIRNLQPSDFTVYRCHIKGQSQEYGQIEIQSHSFSDSPPESNPPQTINECCLDSISQPHCKSMCNMNPLRRSNFAPMTRCMTEFHNLFRCTLTHMNNAACCIKSKIPYQCLGLCEGSYDLDFFELATCLSYDDKIGQCQAETLNLRPQPVSDVENSYSENDGTFTFTWAPSIGAKIYHIYKRFNGEKWSSETSNLTKYTTENVDEIVFLAVNDYGVSNQNRLIFIDGKWITPR